MKTRLFSATLFCLAIVSVGAWSANCAAAIMLDFDQVIDGGTISYDGAGGALIGTDIEFDLVQGNGTPSNDGVTLDITGGVLNFTTGNNSLEGPNLWTFGSGGTFSLSGTVTDPGAGGAVVATGTLLSGSFTGSPVAIYDGTSQINVSAFGIDEKNQDLLDYFGITGNDFVFSNTEIASSNVVVGADGSFSGDVTEADLVNTSQEIPEPAAVAVWSVLGLIGIVAYRRRNRQ